MKKFALAVVVLGVVAFPAVDSRAQWNGPAATKPVLEARLDEMNTVLKLTDEQVKKITAVIEETRGSVKPVEQEFASAHDDYTEALASENYAAMAAANEKWSSLYNKQAEINNKGRVDIDAVLTAEQLAKWREHKYLKPILAKYKDLDITDAQLEKTCVEFKRCVADAKPEDAQEYMFLYRLQTALDKIIQKEILTESQRVKMVMDFVMGQYKLMDLTDAQVAKVKDRATALVKGAGPDDGMHTMTTELSSFIQKDVLTEDQRQKSTLDPILAFYKKVELTDEQVARIKGQLSKLMKEAKPEDPPYSISMKLPVFIQNEVLTDAQREKFILAPMLAMYKVDLTDEQVARIKAQLSKLAKEAKPEDQGYMLTMNLNAFVLKEVMTDAQREKLIFDPMLAMFKRAELTDAQVARIKEQLAKLAKDVKPEEQAYKLTTKLSTFVQKEVLTDEQRAKMGLRARK